MSFDCSVTNFILSSIADVPTSGRTIIYQTNNSYTAFDSLFELPAGLNSLGLNPVDTLMYLLTSIVDVSTEPIIYRAGADGAYENLGVPLDFPVSTITNYFSASFDLNGLS